MRVIRALGALLALMVLTVGWPAALWSLVGNPWPAEGIDLGAPLTDHTIVFALTVLLWILWFQFVGCVLVEGWATVRGGRFPTHVPFALGIQQQLARRLIGTLLTASVGAGVAAAAGSAAATPAAPAETIRSTASTASDNTAAADYQRTSTYTTKANDTLWGIARDQLGDPTRWREVADLNYGRRMNDGRTFVDGDRIQPDWELHLPEGATEQLAAAVSVGGKEPEGVRVQRGDTLSSLAAKHLGDPGRWREIMEANQGRSQADGGRLTDPDVLRPGWVLRMPDLGENRLARNDSLNGSGENKHLLRALHKERSATAESTPRLHHPDSGQSRAETRVGPDPAMHTSETDEVGSEESPVVDDDGASAPLWVAGGVASLLAAGLVGLVTRHRMLQTRRRQFGERIAMPDAPAAAVEEELRQGEDPLGVRVVDFVFRLLAERCQTAELAIPRVQLVRLTAGAVEMYLAEDVAIPSPFEPTQSPSLWQIPRDALSDMEQTWESLRARVPAPYPTLVTLGVDAEGGHVLANLEELGMVGVTGDVIAGREVLSAITLELAMSGWADDLLITVVGMEEHLVDLDTGRIVHRSIDSAIDTLEARARWARGQLVEADMPSAMQARVDEWDDGREWNPEIVIVAGEVDTAKWERLAQVVEELPRVAVAVVAQTADQAQWLVELGTNGDDAEALLHPVGVQIAPQRVTADVYAELVALVETTRQPSQSSGNSGLDEQEPVTVSSRDDPSTAAEAHGSNVARRPAHDDDGGENANDPGEESAGRASVDPIDEPAGEDLGTLRSPSVLVLGPLDVANAGGPMPASRRNKALEIVAYLALRPGLGVEAFVDAVWPGRDPAKDQSSARRNRVREVRKWLDTDPDGRHYLPQFRRGSSYELHPAVRTDWDDWCEFVGDDIAGASTMALESALRLVRGRPFEGVKTGTCAWAQPIITEMLAQIEDVADELGRRMLAAGRWAEAEQAASIGLLCEPISERLYRIQIRSAYASGNIEHAREAIARMLTLFDHLEVDIDDEETALLVRQIQDGASRDAVLDPAL